MLRVPASSLTAPESSTPQEAPHQHNHYVHSYDHSYDSSFKPRRRRLPSIDLPRRTTRQIKRFLFYIVACVALYMLLQLLQGEDGAKITKKSRYGSIWERWFDKRGGTSLMVDPARHRVWTEWRDITRIYAFGDSHTSTGFDLDGPQPRPENPIGNPPMPGRTGNYGPNWLVHLAATFNESFVQVHNFAQVMVELQDRIEPPSPRAEELAMLPLPFERRTVNIDEQVNLMFYPRHGRSQTRSKWGTSTVGSGWGQEDTLFALYPFVDEFSFDYLSRAGAPRNITHVQIEMQLFENNLRQLYGWGARNFLIIGPPSLEESYLFRNSEIPRTLTVFGGEISDTSGRLAFVAETFAHDHPDATVFFFDNHRTSVRARNDPTSWPETRNIRVTEGFCYFYADKQRAEIPDDMACGARLAEFYWRDENHFTEPYHRLMARLCVELMKDVRNAMPLVYHL